jgi:hypothetical protein
LEISYRGFLASRLTNTVLSSAAGCVMLPADGTNPARPVYNANFTEEKYAALVRAVNGTRNLASGFSHFGNAGFFSPASSPGKSSTPPTKSLRKHVHRTSRATRRELFRRAGGA